MNITLNIGLEVSKNYLPSGVEEMHLQYEYAEQYLEKVLGKPICIRLSQSYTEKTVVVAYTNVELVLSELYRIAHALRQDCIAYIIQEDDVTVGGALAGEYAHQWNYGIFNETYFIHADAL